jgi:hypothetical protein
MMLAIAHYALKAGRDVVVDRTHLAAESRSVWVTFVHGWNMNRHLHGGASPVKLIAVEFPTEDPVTHARRRFAGNDRGRDYVTWLDVANKHFRQLLAEPLNYIAEGFDECVRPQLEWTGPKRPELVRDVPLQESPDVR